MTHIDEGALEKAYDDQVSKLFDVLCTSLGLAHDDDKFDDQKVKEASTRFHRGVVVADYAYRVAKNAGAAA